MDGVAAAVYTFIGPPTTYYAAISRLLLLLLTTIHHHPPPQLMPLWPPRIAQRLHIQCLPCLLDDGGFHDGESRAVHTRPQMTKLLPAHKYMCGEVDGWK